MNLRKSIAGLLTVFFLSPLGLLSLPADASPITRTFDFMGSGFGAPLDILIGSATLTFDPMGPQVHAGILASFTSNLPMAPASVLFRYRPGPGLDENLTIYGAVGATSMSHMTNDFNLTVWAPSTTPFAFSLGYAQEDVIGVRTTNTFDLTVTDPRVPEPATAALLAVGLAGLGFSRRRKAV